MTQDQAKQIIDKILSITKADAVRVSAGGGNSSNVRFARNTVTTSGTAQDVSLSITATFGKRSGSYSFNQYDDRTITEAVRNAEELAKLAPEDIEYMPPLGPQSYLTVNAYARETAGYSPAARAAIADDCIAMARQQNLVAAGFVENGDNFSMFANSKGLIAYRTSTDISYSVTARTQDGTGSGWAGGGHTDAAQLNGSALSRRAIEKAIASANPTEVAPGKYTVILEPEAVNNLLGGFGFRMDARTADEGQHQEQHRMQRIACSDHAQRGKQQEGSEHVEHQNLEILNHAQQ